jgi:hypothetical protein
MKEEEERDLRRRFAALRKEDARGAPGFAGLWREAHGRRGSRRSRPVFWLAVAAGTCALLVTTAMVARRPHLSPSAETIITPSLSHWRPPTDFLLQTPALEILTTVPALGEATPLPVVSPSTERSRPS